MDMMEVRCRPSSETRVASRLREVHARLASCSIVHMGDFMPLAPDLFWGVGFCYIRIHAGAHCLSKLSLNDMLIIIAAKIKQTWAFSSCSIGVCIVRRLLR